MNLKDLEGDFEVETEGKKLNLSDLGGDFEMESEELDSGTTEIEDSDINDLNLPGYAGLKAAPEIASALADKTVKGTKGIVKSAIASVPFGSFDADDVSTLYKGRKRYKEIVDKPEMVADAFVDFTKGVEETGYTATKNLGDVLEKQGISMTKDDLISELETRASNMRYEPDSKAIKDAEKAAKNLTDTERKINKAQGYYDKKETDIKNEIEELDDRISEYKQKSSRKQDLAKMRNNERQALDEMIDRLEDQIEYEYDRDPVAKRSIDRDIKKLKRQKRKLGENYQERVIAENKEIKKDLDMIDDLKKKQIKLKRNLRNEVLPNKKKELERLEGLRKSAEKLAKEKAIPKTALSREVRAFLDKYKDEIRKGDLTGKDLANELKYLNTKYGKEGADEVRKAFREMLGDMSEYVGEASGKATQAIVDFGNLRKDLPLKTRESVSKAGKGTEIFHEGADNFNRTLAAIMDQKGDRAIKTELVDTLKRQNAQGLINDAELVRIRELVKSGKASLVDVFNAVDTRGKAAASLGRTLETGLTKTQELATRGAGKLADLAESKPVKAVGEAVSQLAKSPVGKVALPGLAAFGAYSDWQEAGELGFDEPLEKALYTASQAANVLPVSSGQVFETVRDYEKSSPEAMTRVAALKAMFPSVGKGYDVFKETGERKKQVQQITEMSKDRKNAEQLIEEMREVDQDFAEQIKNYHETAKNDEDFAAKMSMLSSDPAYRELVRRRMRRAKNEQSDREQD